MYCCNVLSSKLLPSTRRVKRAVGMILTRRWVRVGYDARLLGAAGAAGDTLDV